MAAEKYVRHLAKQQKQTENSSVQLINNMSISAS